MASNLRAIAQCDGKVSGHQAQVQCSRVLVNKHAGQDCIKAPLLGLHLGVGPALGNNWHQRGLCIDGKLE